HTHTDTHTRRHRHTRTHAHTHTESVYCPCLILTHTHTTTHTHTPLQHTHTHTHTHTRMLTKKPLEMQYTPHTPQPWKYSLPRISQPSLCVPACHFSAPPSHSLITAVSTENITPRKKKK